MAIRKILSRMFITLFVSAILAAVTAAQAQSDNEKLRSMAQLYGVATYALGANEQCDLLDQGEYRGLVVLRDALTPDLSRATTSEVFTDRKSTRLHSGHSCASRLPSSARTNKHKDQLYTKCIYRKLNLTNVIL